MDYQGSYVSNDESPYSPTNLHNQLDGQTPHDWKNDSIDHNSMNNSIENTNVTSGEKEHAPHTPTSTFTIHQIEKAQQSDRSSHSSDHKNQTINIQGQSIKLSQASSSKSQGYISMLKNFLTVNQKTYQKHIQSLQRIIQKVKSFNEKSLQNLEMYAQFFKSKYIQQSSYFETSIKKTNIQQNYMHNSVYINAKMALTALQTNSLSEQKKGIKYLNVLKEAKNYLDLFYKQTKRSKTDEEKKIDNHLLILSKLSGQIETIILSRIHGQNIQDRYIELRYLSEQQKQYIEKLYQLNRITLRFINSNLAEQELKISKTLKEYLSSYCQSYQECYGKLGEIQEHLTNLLSQDTQSHLLNQMAKMLQSVIPCCQSNIQKLQNKNKLNYIVESLRHQLQVNILLPCLDMYEELVVFHSKANWSDGKSKKAMDVVLTSDRYIHLQKDKEFLSIKLTDTKISRKGKQVIICGKGKGVMSYLMGNQQLGRLQFRETRDIQDFTLIVKTLKFNE